MYPLLRPLIFTLDPESAHHAALEALHSAHRLGLATLCSKQHKAMPRTVMGLTFPNAVGLAAGMDKDCAYVDALATLGFGFIEVGTVTPRPQAGNPRPRMFRLPAAQGIINRLGFNNHGVDALVEKVKRSGFRAGALTHNILGINIGKNADTPMEKAVGDYLLCLRKVYAHASYVTINISSPNTHNLRTLQGGDELDDLLTQLKAEQEVLADLHGRYVPLAVKIAPDLDQQQIQQIAALLLRHKMDGVIATNTTLSRSGVENLAHGTEAGGLSGAPLCALSNVVISERAATLQGALPIIGVGGILSGADAAEKMRAGASLVQMYSGLIYRGPDLVGECIDAIEAMS